MGGFDMPGIKVETKALYEFAKDTSTGVPADLSGAQDAFRKLTMQVGGSQLPSAVTMANWNNSVLFALSVHMQKLRLGTGALAEAAMAIGTIYQNSDCSGSEQMNAVNDTFNPKPGDATFSDRMGEQQQEADDRAEEQQQAITAQASETSFGPASTTPGSANGSAQSSVDPETGPCLEGDDVSSAQRLVEQHITDHGVDEDHGYVAPTNTPTQYRDRVHNPPPLPMNPATYQSGPHGTTSPTPTYAGNSWSSTSTSGSTSTASGPTSAPAQSAPSPSPQASPQPPAPTSPTTTAGTQSSQDNTPSSTATPSPQPSAR